MIKYLKLNNFKFKKKIKFHNLEHLKKNDVTIWKINILKFDKLLNIFGVLIISKKWKN